MLCAGSLARWVGSMLCTRLVCERVVYWPEPPIGTTLRSARRHVQRWVGSVEVCSAREMVCLWLCLGLAVGTSPSPGAVVVVGGLTGTGPGTRRSRGGGPWAVARSEAVPV